MIWIDISIKLFFIISNIADTFYDRTMEKMVENVFFLFKLLMRFA